MRDEIKTLASVLLIFALLFSGCAVLNKTQIEAINKLSVSSDTVAIAPSKIFSTLADVRRERGLYYAASISDPMVKWMELNAISDFSQNDQKIVNNADLYVDILGSYLRAIKSLSNDIRWKQYGTEFRGLGRNIDSLITRYNKLDFDYKLPVGYGKVSGKTIAYGSEWFMRVKQTSILKEYINIGDTLVTKCCDELIDILKKDDLDRLLANESSGLRDNYLAYLTHMGRIDKVVPILDERHYLELNQQIIHASLIQKKSISALQSLKKAHNKVALQIKTKSDIDNVIDDIAELNTIALDVTRLLSSK